MWYLVTVEGGREGREKEEEKRGEERKRKRLLSTIFDLYCWLVVAGCTLHMIKFKCLLLALNSKERDLFSCRTREGSLTSVLILS